ncbi:SDR family oxidoreductase [Pontibaca methylaminivorans]|uniref:NADP-dependent 3-hydroxy acid dehydrogenase YdfG n=1 Tax=Pontibaca methylaminivorans TaxID=515897 RepID=A0A1R3WI36_9RHOB|nr:SDR family oxidoreductase [Pontibaca methylaminivorans]SIT77046.1 NADP-dependent 3-hydroxy acid dehydrogenase YdfG [Pontibaca methylaminivorans]
MTRTLLITGASSGIGAATAEAAARAGWQVALMARSADRLEALAARIGPSALALPGDVTQEAEIRRAVAATVERFGALDAAFANAGRGANAPGVETGDPGDWRGMIDLNILGLLLTAHATLPELRKTRGTLVLTGSSAGRNHMKGSVYGATKWFVHGLAGNLAEEMRDWGGRCGVVAPGMVDTPFFDKGAPGKLDPADVAAAVMQMIEAPERASIREVYLMPQNRSE